MALDSHIVLFHKVNHPLINLLPIFMHTVLSWWQYADIERDAQAIPTEHTAAWTGRLSAEMSYMNGQMHFFFFYVFLRFCDAYIFLEVMVLVYHRVMKGQKAEQTKAKSMRLKRLGVYIIDDSLKT